MDHIAFALFCTSSSTSPTVRPTCSPRVLPNGTVTTPRGFRAAGITAGFKPSGAPDLAILLASPDPDSAADGPSRGGGSAPPGAGVAAAGVFTQSAVAAAPVHLCREHLARSGGRAHAVVVNSGQANACTGRPGREDADRMAQWVAGELGVDAMQVLVSSTGVVGRRIDMDIMAGAVPTVITAATEGGGYDAARAIMTTDLVPKTIGMEVETDGGVVRVGGMAKGSGMICPNMATMLSFVTTDAVVEPAEWQALVARAADRSFNQITVDGDTSTNDTLIGLASGASKVSVPQDTLEGMVTEVCQHLARCIARDGEGATVLLEVRVCGAPDDEGALRIAKSVANSNLFKAAVFGRDPNWGRIAVAIGNAGVPVEYEKLTISLGPHCCMQHGEAVQYDEKEASLYMKAASEAKYLSDENKVVVDISVGDLPGQGRAWGCDLSYDYVKINAEYTT